MLLHAGVQLVVQHLFLVGGLGTRVEHWPSVEAGALLDTRPVPVPALLSWPPSPGSKFEGRSVRPGSRGHAHSLGRMALGDPVQLSCLCDDPGLRPSHKGLGPGAATPLLGPWGPRVGGSGSVSLHGRFLSYLLPCYRHPTT